MNRNPVRLQRGKRMLSRSEDFKPPRRPGYLRRIARLQEGKGCAKVAGVVSETVKVNDSSQSCRVGTPFIHPTCVRQNL